MRPEESRLIFQVSHRSNDLQDIIRYLIVVNCFAVVVALSSEGLESLPKSGMVLLGEVEVARAIGEGDELTRPCRLHIRYPMR